MSEKSKPAEPLENVAPESAPVTVADLRALPILAESFKKKGDKWFENKVLPFVVRRRFEAEQLIVRAGEYRDAAYYLASGTVEVLVETLQGGGARATMVLPALGVTGKGK